MGLIKAITGAADGTLADQWKEFFYCDALDADTLVVKGQKRTSRRSTNTKGEDNIISSGSGIAVADGQCMLIVEQGKVVEVCAEPGEYTFDRSTEPSIFAGSLGEGLKKTFATIGKRFTYGGDTGKDQRVYYINTKEIIGNKFGTATPIPFRIVDTRVNLDLDASVRCNGIYSYKITNPILFYTNVCGNVSSRYERSEIDSQLKAEFISYLQPAFGRISELGIRPSYLGSHVTELCDAVNEAADTKWQQERGIKVVSIAINSVSLPEEVSEQIKQLQFSESYSNPGRAAGLNVMAQSEAMKTAAGNSAGAMTGFMGMGMAMQNGGMNTQELYRMDAERRAQEAEKKAAEMEAMMKQQQMKAAAPAPAPATDSWTCSCGTVNSGKFCVECGSKKPVLGWTCSCGSVNKGKFCPECGSKKPEAEPLYRCDKCGWEPEDPHHPPKFCPECGDPFNDADIR